MEKRFTQFHEFEKFFKTSNNEKPEKMATMCWLLHCADIGNASKGKELVI